MCFLVHFLLYFSIACIGFALLSSFITIATAFISTIGSKTEKFTGEKTSKLLMVCCIAAVVLMCLGAVTGFAGLIGSFALE